MCSRYEAGAKQVCSRCVAGMHQVRSRCEAGAKQSDFLTSAATPTSYCSPSPTSYCSCSPNSYCSCTPTITHPSLLTVKVALFFASGSASIPPSIWHSCSCPLCNMAGNGGGCKVRSRTCEMARVGGMCEMQDVQTGWSRRSVASGCECAAGV